MIESLSVVRSIAMGVKDKSFSIVHHRFKKLKLHHPFDNSPLKCEKQRTSAEDMLACGTGTSGGKPRRISLIFVIICSAIGANVGNVRKLSICMLSIINSFTSATRNAQIRARRRSTVTGCIKPSRRHSQIKCDAN